MVRYARKPRRTRLMSNLFVGLVTLLSASGAIALEPQALLGDWDGEWRSTNSNGTVSVTIKKVSGDQIEGSLIWHTRRQSASYHNMDLPFTATLVGNTLSVQNAPTKTGSPPMTFSYEINEEGTKMEGFFHVMARSSVSLVKKK